MKPTTRPGQSNQPGTELTEAELDGATGGMLAVTRVTSPVIRPTTQPTGPGTGTPGTSQDTQTDKPFQPQTGPR